MVRTMGLDYLGVLRIYTHTHIYICVYMRYGRLPTSVSTSLSNVVSKGISFNCPPSPPSMGREQAHVGALVEVKQGG